MCCNAKIFEAIISVFFEDIFKTHFRWTFKGPYAVCKSWFPFGNKIKFSCFLHIWPLMLCRAGILKTIFMLYTTGYMFNCSIFQVLEVEKIYLIAWPPPSPDFTTWPPPSPDFKTWPTQSPEFTAWPPPSPDFTTWPPQSPDFTTWPPQSPDFAA
jgi:hypothetical protein